MVNTTAQYKEAIKKNRILHHEAKIRFSNGTEKILRNEKLFQLSILENTSNENSFDIGSAIAKQLTIKLDNLDGAYASLDFSDAIITVRTGLEVNGSIEWIDKGSFTAEPGKNTGDTITVTAFDSMIHFDELYSLSNIIYPATLGEIIRDACTCCGVPMSGDIASFPNSNFVVKARPTDSTITFRQVISWVCQIACRYAKINSIGQLTFGWYNTSLLKQGIDTLQRNSGVVKIENFRSGSTVSTDDIMITGIRVVEETGDSEEIYQSGQDGYVLEISGNQLIQDGNGEQVAAYLNTQLNCVGFRPLKAICQTDPSIEAGDIALVTDRKGRTYKTILTGVQYNAGGTQTVISSAETPQRVSAARLSAATKLYKKFRQGLSRNKTQWESAMEALEQAMSAKKGLFPVQEIKEDGSKVYYLCDRPTLEESDVVFELNANGWAVSTDGGEHWNAGLTVDGTMITKILNTIGINADWINAGSFSAKDTTGQETFYVNTETGEVRLAPKTLSISGQTVAQIADAEVQKFVNDVYTKNLEELQEQVDGQIEIHYYPHEPTLTNKPANTWTTETERSKHVGDLLYNTETGFAYRYKRVYGGVKIKFSAQCRTESVTYDWVQIFYQIGNKIFSLPKIGGTSLANAEIFVPSANFWLHWRTDGSQDAYYGFSIDSITADTGEHTGTPDRLPTAKETAEASGSTYPESVHGNYGNSISKLWTYQSGLSVSNTYSWIRVKDSDITAAKAAADAAKETADNKKRVFLETPVPPYDTGDLWTQGTSGDIMVCIKAKDTGTYASSDWQKCSKYTDDTRANLALERIESVKTLNVILSNEYQAISVKADGTYTTFPAVSTAIMVYIGTVEATEECTFSVSKSSGITGTWNEQNKTYTVTALTTDEGYVEITASHSRYSLSGKKKFTISKAKSGTDGGTWTLEVSSNTVKRGEDGGLSPSSITANAYFQTGNSAERSAYTGRLYCYTSTDGSTWTQKSTVSSGNTITVSLSGLSSSVYWLKFTLCAAGTNTVIDQQIVQVLDDISSLTGAIMLQKLSGGWQGIYQDSKGNYYIDARYIQAGTISGEFIDAKKLTVKNGTKTTLSIDEYGKVTINAESLSIGGLNAATENYANKAAGKALEDAEKYINGKSPEEILNLLTNNGAMKGIYIANNQLYINAAYIVADDLKAISAKIGGWTINTSNIASANYSASNRTGIALNSNGTIKVGNTTLDTYASALRIQSGLMLYGGGNSSDFSDGTAQIQIYNLPHVTSGGHLVFGNDGSTLSYLSSSSKRYKEHVNDMDFEEARKLLDLPVVHFKYKEGYLSQGDRLYRKEIPGFYAEDIDEIYPAACQYNADGLPEDWNYRTMIPAMLKLIQNIYMEMNL